MSCNMKDFQVLADFAILINYQDLQYFDQFQLKNYAKL